MSNYTPKVGDRVRVTVEGTVGSVDEDGGLDLAHGDDFHGASIAGVMVVSIEHIEPEWLPEDVVLDAKGKTYISRQGVPGESWPWCGLLGGVSNNVPVRPLTLIVRDGKAVRP